MVVDLQKASVWKRIAAWLLDFILLIVLVVGFMYLLSGILGYDSYNDKVEAAQAKYEAQYGIRFDSDRQSLTEQEQKAYDDAYAALNADTEALQAYNMVVNLSLLMATFGILLAMLILEFVVPLILKNGQTIGKKCFSIGLMRTDGVKMNHLQLFTRTVLGKFAIETMIPVYILLMIFWEIMGVEGTLFLGALLIAQLVCVGVTRTNSAIHDLLAGTVAVDLSSQEIFQSTEALIEYTKRIHAERAAKKEY